MDPRLTGCAAVAGLAAVLGAGPVLAAPAVLRDAEARVTVTAPTACEVDLSVSIDGSPAVVEHRLEVLAGATVVVVGTPGAASSEAPRTVGRTQVLTLRPDSATYAVRYRVTQPPAGAFRCPLWLPTTPADGRSRAVRLTVTLPPGARPSGTMPSFKWAGPVGTATLGHLPAFVRLPYGTAGMPAPWNLARAMDGVSAGVLVLASLLWWRQSRR
jgi:hypothetical protein